MVILFDERQSTRDLDVAIILPKDPTKIRKLVSKVGIENNWPDHWLNDAAKAYLIGLSVGEIVFSAPGIIVKRPSFAQLLAMKLSAWRPQTGDERVLAAAASLIELFAERSKQNPPSWTKKIGALKEPIYLVPSADKMKRLRELCENESPQPLRKRGFYAPPNFLEFA